MCHCLNVQHAFADVASLEDAVARESAELLTLNDAAFDKSTDMLLTSMTTEVSALAVTKVKSAAARAKGVPFVNLLGMFQLWACWIRAHSCCGTMDRSVCLWWGC